MHLRVLFLPLLAACAPALEGDAAAGGPIFATNCSSCHGADGTGGSGPSLVDSTYAEAKTVDIVTNGDGDMPAFSGSLSDQDIADVAAYVDVTFVNP